MRSPVALLALSLLFACDNRVLLPPADGPIGIPDPVPSALCAAEPAGRMIDAAGEVSGVWSGHVAMTGEVVIAEGAELEICPGTVLAPQTLQTALVVHGSLVLSGTPGSMISVEEVAWAGLQVH